MAKHKEPRLRHRDRDLDSEHAPRGPKLGGGEDICETCGQPVEIELT